MKIIKKKLQTPAALFWGKRPRYPLMGPKAVLDDLRKRKISCPCRETNITGLVNKRVAVTCSGMEEEKTAYRILRDHLNN
jgi:hypothetical protein